MASILTRSSVLAVVKETTEGELKLPTLATQYVALQDDFSISPSFESLDNAELKASIGAAKPIVGKEAPSASMSHYLRHSGVEGTAPNYGLFLESCLGATSVASTEYDTVAASTTTVIKVGVGEGATFERGEAILIKDGVNGWRVRCLDSVVTDDLNIGFQVPVAPALGINLGRCVLYKPANENHPTLSLHHYLGNGGAIQSLAGSRVVSAEISVTAGELINASYSLEGVGYFYDQMTTTATTNKVQFDIGGGPVTATVAVKSFKSPHELASAVQAAMTTAAAGTYTVAYNNADGKFTVTKSAGTLDIDWLTGVDSIGALMGFTADDTGALTYTSDVAQDWSSPQNPTFDASDPLAAKDNEVMVGTTTEYACFKASSVSMSISSPKAEIASVCAQSGVQGSIVQSREVTVSVSALIEQHDVAKFNQFINNSDIKFQYTFGTKTGGNWIAGKTGAMYVPTCAITSYEISDADGLAQLDLELKAFVNSNGDGEAYVAFV